MNTIQTSRVVLVGLLASWVFTPIVRAEDAPPPKKFHWKDIASPSQESPTVVGVRGLDKGQDSGDTKSRDYAAIDRLDAVTVSPAELQQFVKEGKLR